MRKPNPVQNDIIRDEILSAARGLFQTYGLTKTTMEDIAEAAGKGKSTLYYYFKSKDEVFYALASMEFKGIMELIAKAIKWTHCAEDRLKVFFTTRDNAIRSKARLYPIVFRETRKNIHLFHKIQRESNTAEIKMLKSILLEGIASGEFKSIKKEDCDTVAITCMTAMHGMDINLLMEGKTTSEQDRLSAIMNIFVRGLK